MKIVVLRRWAELSRKHQFILGGIAVVAVIFLGSTIWSMFNPETPSSFSGKNSLPVNASIEGAEIQFSSEKLKPLPEGEDYFVNYRLQREQSRQEAKVMLSPLLNSTVNKTKEEAQLKWLELSQRIEKESQIENLLKIKGFQDAVVDVNKSSVNVIIYASALSPEEIRMIQDITTRVANIRVEQVRISYKK